MVRRTHPTPAGTQIAHRETKGAQREALPKGRSSDALLLVGVAVLLLLQGGGRDGGEGLGGNPLKARW